VNPVARQLIVDHAAVVTTENALKMEPTRPEQGVFHFWEADKIIEYSQELGIQVHGHAASWHMQNPDWLVNGSFSDDELIDILENHVSTLTQRYDGQLISLDVANEAYWGGYNCGPWCALGNNYTQTSFESAQNSASYPIIYNSVFSSDDECTQALNLLDQGLVDGIGIQLHLYSGGWEASLARMDAFLDQIQQHGGSARLSEIGVLADEQTQATVYAAITALAVKHSDIVTDFVVWGITDEVAWRGPVSLFDYDGQPKPAYYAVVEELKR
jgi:endo-1,4-beta-xylanase